MLDDNWIIIRVPEYWLVYLEHGDESGYSDGEIDTVESWLKDNDYKYVSSGSSLGLSRFDGVLCDLCNIIVEKKGE